MATKKRAGAFKTDDSLCSFCQQSLACVSVERPLPHRLKKRYTQRLCLLHYYGTSAVREKAQYVSIIDPALVQEQTPKVQELFAEAFVQLQQTLQEETDKALSVTNNNNNNSNNNSMVDDPLAGAVAWKRSSKQQARAPRPKKQARIDNEGGFLRAVPLPQRMLQTQKQQALKQRQLVLRMQHTDTTRRRQPSQKSVWNVVLDDAPRHKKPAPLLLNDDDDVVAIQCSSCQSDKVKRLGNLTSRNGGETAKAETWGTKDRSDDVVVRYQCQGCGKVWNETE